MNSSSPSESTTEIVKRSIDNAIELFDEIFHDIAPINSYNDAGKGRGVGIPINSLSDRQCLIIKELSGHLTSAKRNLLFRDDPDMRSPAALMPGMGLLAASIPTIALSNADPAMQAMERKMSMLRDYLMHELVRSEGAEQALKKKEDEMVEVTAECEKLRKKLAHLSAPTVVVSATTTATAVKSTVKANPALAHNLYANSRASSADRIDTQPLTYVHTYVRKQFGSSYFFGIVASYDAVDQYFQIVYEDADYEDLSHSELRRVLWSGSTPVAKREVCLKHAKLLGMVSDEHYEALMDADATAGASTYPRVNAGNGSGYVSSSSDNGGDEEVEASEGEVPESQESSSEAGDQAESGGNESRDDETGSQQESLGSASPTSQGSDDEANEEEKEGLATRRVRDVGTIDTGDHDSDLDMGMDIDSEQEVGVGLHSTSHSSSLTSRAVRAAAVVSSSETSSTATTDNDDSRDSIAPQSKGGSCGSSSSSSSNSSSSSGKKSSNSISSSEMANLSSLAVSPPFIPPMPVSLAAVQATETTSMPSTLHNLSALSSLSTLHASVSRNATASTNTTATVTTSTPPLPAQALGGVSGAANKVQPPAKSTLIKHHAGNKKPLSQNSLITAHMAPLTAAPSNNKNNASSSSSTGSSTSTAVVKPTVSSAYVAPVADPELDAIAATFAAQLAAGTHKTNIAPTTSSVRSSGSINSRTSGGTSSSASSNSSSSSSRGSTHAKSARTMNPTSPPTSKANAVNAKGAKTDSQSSHPSPGSQAATSTARVAPAAPTKPAPPPATASTTGLRSPTPQPLHQPLPQAPPQRHVVPTGRSKGVPSFGALSSPSSNTNTAADTGNKKQNTTTNNIDIIPNTDSTDSVLAKRKSSADALSSDSDEGKKARSETSAATTATAPPQNKDEKKVDAEIKVVRPATKTVEIIEID